MTITCEEHRSLMVAHLRGELAALEEARMRAHLERCSECAGVERTLREGLSEARAWSPEASEAHVSRLTKRLVPYVGTRTEIRGLRAAGFALAALTASGVAFFLANPERPIERVESIKPIARTEPIQQIQPVEALEPMSVKELSPRLHVLSTKSWDGRLERSDTARPEVEISRGLAVMEFRGEPSAFLSIDTPDVKVEIENTRCFVDVVPGLHTTVGVISGRATIHTSRGDEVIEAGSTRKFDRSGTAVPSERPHVDMSLLDVSVARAEPSATRRATNVAPRSPAPHPDPAAVLRKAERLAHDGNVDGALALYAKALDDRHPAYDPLRALMRYELARLIGFDKKDTERARRLFADLAKGDRGEVALQAKLALCELDLALSPCLARTCLERLSSDEGVPASVQDEALRLVTRWGIQAIACTDHKE